MNQEWITHEFIFPNKGRPSQITKVRNLAPPSNPILRLAFVIIYNSFSFHSSQLHGVGGHWLRTSQGLYLEINYISRCFLRTFAFRLSDIARFIHRPRRPFRHGLFLLDGDLLTSFHILIDVKTDSCLDLFETAKEVALMVLSRLQV